MVSRLCWNSQTEVKRCYANQSLLIYSGWGSLLSCCVVVLIGTTGTYSTSFISEIIFTCFNFHQFTFLQTFQQRNITQYVHYLVPVYLYYIGRTNAPAHLPPWCSLMQIERVSLRPVDLSLKAICQLSVFTNPEHNSIRPSALQLTAQLLPWRLCLTLPSTLVTSGGETLLPHITFNYTILWFEC